MFLIKLVREKCIQVILTLMTRNGPMFLRNRRNKKPRALLFLYLWKWWDSFLTSAESLEK